MYAHGQRAAIAEGKGRLVVIGSAQVEGYSLGQVLVKNKAVKNAGAKEAPNERNHPRTRGPL